MVSASAAKDLIVDADAHVVESAHTWDYHGAVREAVPPCLP